MIMSDDKDFGLRNLNEKVLARGKYVYSDVTYDLRKRDGRWEPHERHLFRRPDAAVLLP